MRSSPGGGGGWWHVHIIDVNFVLKVGIWEQSPRQGLGAEPLVYVSNSDLNLPRIAVAVHMGQ